MSLLKIKSFKAEVSSSIVDSVEYDYLSNQMVVKFKKGKYKRKVKTIDNISFTKAIEIISSSSVGKSVLKLLHQQSKSSMTLT
jgi:hypothetical protein